MTRHRASRIILLPQGESTLDLYYAYGSNMSVERLLARVPRAQSLGAARLSGWRILCNKPGADGSGKANLVEDAAASVWGVLYRIRIADWQVLDGFEPGYARIEEQVVDLSEQLQRAQLYVWRQVTPELPMIESYREHLLQGAREHSLPADYLSTLGSLPFQPS